MLIGSDAHPIEIVPGEIIVWQSRVRWREMGIANPMVLHGVSVTCIGGVCCFKQ
jgi:hypothetical protein